MPLFTELFEWIIRNLESVVEAFKNSFLEIINLLIQAIANLIEAGASLLPEFSIPAVSSLTSVSDTIGAKILGAINWFIPFDLIVILVGIWGASELIYIVSAPVLRWLKLVAR